MKNKMPYDISKMGLESPPLRELEIPYDPFDYKAKYTELLKVISDQQKEIEQLKKTQKQIISNMNKLVEVINNGKVES